MPTKPRIWTDERIIELRTLAETGITAANVAATLSFRWSDWLQNPITEEAVRQQASRWDIRLMGRSTGQTAPNSDPLAMPSWLEKREDRKRELEGWFPTRFPFKVVHHDEEEPTDEDRHETKRLLWVDYLTRNGLLTRNEAESEPMREWFAEMIPVYEMVVRFDEGVESGPPPVPELVDGENTGGLSERSVILPRPTESRGVPDKSVDSTGSLGFVDPEVSGPLDGLDRESIAIPDDSELSGDSSEKVISMPKSWSAKWRARRDMDLRLASRRRQN